MLLRLAGDQVVVKTFFLSIICFETHEAKMKNFNPFKMTQEDGDLLKVRSEERPEAR